MHEPWLERPHPIGNGEQRVYRFENGFGASVVKTKWTYGGDKDLWELAVVKFDGDEWSLTYDTPITNDVIGWLDDEAVEEKLSEIESLTAPAESSSPH